MANHVTNRITILGNSAIKSLVKEMIHRFELDLARNKGIDDNGCVGRVLYGLKEGQAKIGFEVTGSNWVYVEGPFEIDKPFRFISAWSTVGQLQDYILTHAAKLDKNVIVINEYSEETARFIGCRIVQLHQGNILEYIEHEDTSGLTIVEDEYPDDDEDQDDENDREPGETTWDDLWSQLDDMKLNLIDEVVKDNPSHNKEKLLQMMK